MASLLLHFEDETAQASRLAEAAGLPSRCIERHRFPDGELRLRLPPELPEDVVMLRSLHDPNEKLVELLLAANTARTLGARRITLVTPYLGYMRQDIAFRPGEAVSQRIVGGFLARLFDAVLTVDPHLHRIARLDEAIPVAQAIVLSAAPLLAELAVARRGRPLLVGPDAESAQWVESAAAALGLDHTVCTKVRHGDRDVDIRLPAVDFAGRPVVLIDDIASTGRTVARAARQLLRAGAVSVDLAVTHALFAADALDVVREAGIDGVWSTDCVPHVSNVVSVAPMLAQALRHLPEGMT
jgi:ribose-phosphate pyrophosphokinase